MSMTAVPISIRLVRAADRGQQRERGGQLPLEVVHADERPVDPEVLGRLGQLDGLQQRVGGGPGL